MTRQHFQVGDRVRLLRDWRQIPAGTEGTVVLGYSTPTWYEVQFDTHYPSVPVSGRDLELVRVRPAP
jgi:hypothetical protein